MVAVGVFPEMRRKGRDHGVTLCLEEHIKLRHRVESVLAELGAGIGRQIRDVSGFENTRGYTIGTSCT